MTVTEPVRGFAMAVVRDVGGWRCSAMDNSALSDLDTALTQLAKVQTDGASLALLGVDDEFFVIVRPSPGRTELMVSDATAALDYDIAADALELLRVEVPDDDDDAWPEGDLHILTDLGLPAEELEMISVDEDLYPDEQLRMVARRCGFGDQFDEVLGASE